MYPSRVGLAKRAGLGEERICQRCEKPGHAIYECKNPRPYKTRPTRAQVLANPKLEAKWKPKEAPLEDVRRPGTADDILAERERERAPRRSRSPDVSDYDSDASSSHPPSCSTCSPRSDRGSSDDADLHPSRGPRRSASPPLPRDKSASGSPV